MAVPTEGCSNARAPVRLAALLAAQAVAFAVGAWQGYGFGALIGGTPLGVVVALNMGVMAAVAAGSAVGWLQRLSRG